MFGFFKRLRIGGEIAFYGLQDWWLTSFTSEEQAYIIRKVQPLGTGSSNGLITGSVSWSSQSAVTFLQSLSGWFNNPRDRHIAIRILNKAEELSKVCTSGPTGKLTKEQADIIVENYFLYIQIIKTFYPLRNSHPGALEKVIEACRSLIALAPLSEKALRKKFRDTTLLPVYTGYGKLAIILEKQKKFEEALALCKEASKTKWGGGGWEAQIERLTKKLQKLSK